MIYACMRQVPGLDNLTSQKHEILTFAHQKGIDISQEVIEYATKDLILDERREFEAFLRSLDNGKFTILVSTLSVLSSRVEELVKVFSCVISHDVDLWICDEDICINKESAMTEVFPLFEKYRTKPKENIQVGRPKGSKSSSKFDVFHSEIMRLLARKKSVSAIARHLEVSRSSLKDYVESRGLKSLAMSIGASAQTLATKEMDNIVLICPFEVDEEERKAS